MFYCNAEDVVAHAPEILVKYKGRLTVARMAADTGLTIVEAETALLRCLELYECRVALDDKTGDTLFIFSQPLRQRGRIQLREKVFRFGKKIRQISKTVYRASLGVVMGVYAAIFSLIFSDGLLLDFWSWNWWDSQKHKKSKPSDNHVAAQHSIQHFWAMVFQFVFGPDTKSEMTEPEKAAELATFVVQNNGKLTAAHIIALQGCDYGQAEQRLAEAVARFRGELHHDRSGVLVGEFSDFNRHVNLSISDQPRSKPTFYPSRKLVASSFTGNTTGQNLLVGVLNSSNLIGSALLWQMFRTSEPLLSAILGVFPFIVSVLCFTIPILRLVITALRENEEKRIKIRQQMMNLIMNLSAPRISHRNLCSGKYAQQNPDLAEQVLVKLLVELDGEIIWQADGTKEYRFERFLREFRV